MVLPARPVAVAQTELKVLVTVHKVWEDGCFGEMTFLGCVGGEDADFYGVTEIAGQRFETQQAEDQTSIEPNWQFSKVAAPDALVPVRVQIWDYDSGARGGDDHVDIAGDDALDLTLTVVVGKDASGCRVGGNFASPAGNTAKCGERLLSSGRNEEDAAGIEFSVDVSYPTRVGRNTLLCTHTPLWPQPGQAVTINALAMDIQTGTTPAGTLGFPHSYTFNAVQASKIQIWWNANGATVNRSLAQECLNPAAATGCTANVTPTGATFQYGCWVERNSATVSSNYREVSVGAPPNTNIVPVLYGNPKERAVDVVIHPDRNYATDAAVTNGWTNAQFLTDATTIVNGALAEPIWVQFQSRINIWISQRAGNPQWPASGPCNTGVAGHGFLDGRGPEPFGDGNGVIHRRTLANTTPPPATCGTRDGALGRMFTTNALFATAPNTMRHELGHTVFGLADEYANDGGYWQSRELPNVYSSAASCAADIADLDKISAELLWPQPSTCRSFQQATPNPPAPGTFPTPMTWWVVDPTTFQSGATTGRDLMVANTWGMMSDIRRFRWVFNSICPLGGC
jgi:hypothetical protein